jgi:Bacterial Ig-like domain (group 2)
MKMRRVIGKKGAIIQGVKPSVRLLGLGAVMGWLSGCGGGTTSQPVSMVSITVTPVNASIQAPATQQFTATGAFSDSSTADITKSVSWTSSDASKATVQNSGLATGVTTGSVTITAASAGKTGAATLTITAPPTLTSLSISPLNPTIAANGTQQFFANATYSDNSVQDVTQNASWTSSNPNVATIQSTGQQNPGLAEGVGAGAATITVSFNGQSSSTLLTVTSPGGNGSKIPLMDMTPSENYLTFQGGLYENSGDTVPADHEGAGLAAAAAIQPLDTNGNPSASGKIVFVAVGRSIGVDEFAVFMKQAATNSGVNQATLVIVNGALSGAMPCVWTVATGLPSCNPTLGNQYDRVRDTVLTPLGLTEKQVQAAWIEEYNGDPAADGFQSLCDPTVAGCSNDVSHTEALRYEQQLAGILRAAKARWPNFQQAFQSTRIYGGYATTNHSSEPYPYEYGFSAKWLIEAQILQIRSGGTSIDPTAGDLNYQAGVAPWTAWGPYTWANGDTLRSDGLVWCNGQATSPCNGEVDFQTDGIHPSTQGDQKVANLLLHFFLNSSYTPWFRP